MKRFTPGFNLIEVMIALAIAGMVLTPLLILQGTSIGFSARSWRLYDRMVHGYNALVQSVFVPEIVPSLSKKSSLVSLQLNTSAVPEPSSLKDIPLLQLHRLELSWSERSRQKKDILIALTYKQEKAQQ